MAGVRTGPWTRWGWIGTERLAMWGPTAEWFRAGWGLLAAVGG